MSQHETGASGLLPRLGRTPPGIVDAPRRDRARRVGTDSLLRTLRFAAWTALATFGAVACGGTSGPAPSAEVVLSAEEREALARAEADARAHALCVDALEGVRSAEFTVYYSLPPQAASTLVVENDTLVSSPEDSWRTRYEQRDERGQSIGLSSWNCEGDTLALERVDTDSVTLHLRPPLPMIPLGEPLDTVREGTVDRIEGGAMQTLTYRWRARSEIGSAPLPFLGLPVAWIRVESQLDLETAEGAHVEIVTETLWARGDDLLFAAQRTQRQTEAGISTERREVAEHLQRPR